jgi:hypothetical protein
MFLECEVGSVFFGAGELFCYLGLPYFGGLTIPGNIVGGPYHVGDGSTMITRVVEPAPLGGRQWGQRK